MYNNKPHLLEYPPQPAVPKYFKTQLQKIPVDDVDQAVKDTKEYTALLLKYQLEVSAIATENRRRENEYVESVWNEIFEEHGIGDGERTHELVSWASSKAWEDGHAGGMGEVASCFAKFIEAYDIHRKLITKLQNDFHKAKMNQK